MMPSGYKRKADCTPEEWDRFRARRREWEKKKRKEDPEWEKRRRERALENNPEYMQERNRRKYDRILADPEKHARRLAIVRKSEAKRRMRERVRRKPETYIREIRKTLRGTGPDTDDIVAEAIMALLDGRAATLPEAIEAGRKAHFRQFSRYTTLSLDMTISGDPSGDRYVDQLPDPTHIPIEELLDA